MANDCLVTKLKGVVDNDNLSKLGVLQYEVYVDNGKAFGIKCANAGESVITLKNATVASVVRGTVIDSTHVSIGVEGQSGNTFVTINENISSVIVEVSNKYNITYLGDTGIKAIKGGLAETDYLSELAKLCLNNYGSDSNLSAFANAKYTDSLKLLYIDNSGGKMSGDISSLSIFKNLQNFRCTNNTAINGNILSFDTLTDLAALNIDGTRISGTVEEFVAAQRTAGRTTGSIQLGYTMALVTYNGLPITGSSDKTLAWTADSITIS
jgi:hypothetical protein